jgi:hypothetical protein
MELAEPPVLGFELIDPECPGDDETQNVDIDGLVIEIVRAETDGSNCIDAIAVSRHYDNFRVRSQCDDLFERSEPLFDVGIFGGHSQILEDDGRLVATQLTDGVRVTVRRDDLVVFEAGP